MTRIAQVSFDQVAHISKMASKVILPFKPSYDIYALLLDDVIVATSCLYFPSKHVLRFDGAFVLPEHRGKGYGLELLEHRWNLAHFDDRYKGAKVIDCYAYYPKWYLEKGFTVCKKHSVSTYVRYTVGAQGTR